MLRSNRSRKLTVESCGALGIHELQRNRTFELGFSTWHTLELTGFCPGMPRKMRFVLQMTGRGTECLFFRFRAPNGDFERGRLVQYIIEVPSQPCRYGGKRRWLRCPLIHDGIPCQKLALKLFLPPGALYFGCRTCYGLTYRSVQEHDQRVDDLSRKDWPELGALLKLPFRQRSVVHKAINKKQVRFFKTLKSSRNQVFDSLI